MAAIIVPGFASQLAGQGSELFDGRHQNIDPRRMSDRRSTMILRAHHQTRHRLAFALSLTIRTGRSAGPGRLLIPRRRCYLVSVCLPELPEGASDGGH